jgi:hypothetical protein
MLLPADIPLRLKAAITSVQSFDKASLKRALISIYGVDSEGAEELRRLAGSLLPKADNSSKVNSR